MGDNTYPAKDNALDKLKIVMKEIALLYDADREEVIKIIDFLVLNEDNQRI